MKKSVLMVLVIVWALLVVLAGCGADDISLDVKPEKTNLEFWVKYEVEDEESLGQRMWWNSSEPAWYLAKGYEPSGFDKNGNANGLPEEYVLYAVYPYPRNSDSKKVVTIKITDPDICICGITVDSSEADFEKTFKKLGCEIAVSKLANGDVHIGARKGNVNVGLSKLADGSRYLNVTVDIGYDDDTAN